MSRRTFKPRYTANLRIRVPELRVISDRGEQIGIMDTKDALQAARDQGKDLVMITESAKPPVAKIIELTKHKYQQQQKLSESRKKARAQDIKEVRFTPFMSENDFSARLKKVLQFLKKGDKVRLSLFFKGRAITKKEFGYDIFKQVIEATQEIGTIEMEPKLLGKKLIAQLTPSKTVATKSNNKEKNEKI